MSDLVTKSIDTLNAFLNGNDALVDAVAEASKVVKVYMEQLFFFTTQGSSQTAAADTRFFVSHPVTQDENKNRVTLLDLAANLVETKEAPGSDEVNKVVLDELRAELSPVMYYIESLSMSSTKDQQDLAREKTLILTEEED